jgi:hypothetical protein
MTPIKCSWDYYPNNTGLIVGLIVAANGIGSAYLTFIIKAMINPLDVKPLPTGFYPVEIQNNLRGYFIFEIIFFGCLSVLGILMVIPYEPETLEEKAHTMKKFHEDLLVGNDLHETDHFDTHHHPDSASVSQNDSIDEFLEKKLIVNDPEINNVDLPREDETKNMTIVDTGKKCKNNLPIVEHLEIGEINELETRIRAGTTKKQVVKLRQAILSKQNWMFFVLAFCNYCKIF